ncbi:unnamed protein product, partial [marine sediment metagenome]
MPQIWKDIFQQDFSRVFSYNINGTDFDTFIALYAFSEIYIKS